MTKTIFRRIFPPAFLRKAEYQRVDVGAYLPPAEGASRVWVGQTEAQYHAAVALCHLLECVYGNRAEHWLYRTRRVLNDPPREIVERSIEWCGRG